MGLDTTRFARLRPCLYHLTARANLQWILAGGGIDAAAESIRRSGLLGLLTEKRRGHVALRVDGHDVTLRDQAPLHAGNIRLEDGFDFADLVRHLNERVFFWPGTEGSPIAYGIRHFRRYADEGCAVLVLSTRAVLEANGHRAAEFCRYNSGSPRCSRGVRSPRGPCTFLGADRFGGPPADVVEVVFKGRVDLPAGAFRVSELNEWI